jgi:peptidoglycan/xylan/chitin deacetylase (PgdA/CDA1 family)
MVFPRMVHKILPFQALVNFSGRKLFLPFYHTVSDIELPHIKHLYQVKNTQEFEKELDFILKHFKPVTASELLDCIGNRKKIRHNSVLFSFDDGLREMYDVVFPILKRKGIPALFFLNSAFVDNKDLFFRYKASVLYEYIGSAKSSLLPLVENTVNVPLKSNADVLKWLLSVNYSNREELDHFAKRIGVDFSQYLIDWKPYLTFGQISEMVVNGFNFGAHSIDHPYYSELSLKEQLRQSNESVQFVREKFGVKQAYFSFPFFDDGVSLSFYKEMFSDLNPNKPNLIFGSSGLVKDEFPLALQRLCMEKSTSTGEDFIYMAYFKYIIKTIVRRNTRKHLLL